MEYIDTGAFIVFAMASFIFIIVVLLTWDSINGGLWSEAFRRVFVDWWWDWLLMPPTNYNNLNIMGENKTMGFAGGYRAQRWNDVLVKTYKDKTNPGLGMEITRETFFKGSALSHSWRWIQEKSEYGWVEDEPKPIPKPSIFASAGAEEDMKSILAEYNTHKNDNRITFDAIKTTKPPEQV